jgi:Fur family ferric uptake transcriptional regulator
MNLSRPSRYNTRQGKLLVDYLASLGERHVTANEIAAYFEGQPSAIGLTTIYRHLEKLAKTGIIRKYIPDEGASACYQYISENKTCREHFHLRCEQCGTLIHLECDELDNIRRHMMREHDFQINTLKTVFYGTCKKCSGGV